MQNQSSPKQKQPNRLVRRSLISTAAVMSALLVATSATPPAMAASPTSPTIVIDGDAIHQVLARGSETQDILEVAGITTEENDRIVVEEKQDSTTITVKRAIEIPLYADGQTTAVSCYTGDTVAQVLARAGISLGESDQVNLDFDATILPDTEITVTRYYNVYVVDRGVARAYCIPEGTVAESMATTDFVLEGENVFSNAQAPVSENLVIGVDHISYQEVQTTEEIPFSVVEQSSDTLYKGSTQVKTEGVNGSKTVTHRQKLVNGEVVSSEVVKEDVITPPVDKVVLLGSKPKPSAVATSISVTPQGTLVDASGKAVSYSRKIVGSCTAYTGGGITSTGRPAAVGRVAVNPNVIPYGSKLYICSPDGKYVYGYAIASDTGGALMSGRVLCDLYMNSYGECVNFGRRPMAVYVLN